MSRFLSNDITREDSFSLLHISIVIFSEKKISRTFVNLLSECMSQLYYKKLGIDYNTRS